MHLAEFFAVMHVFAKEHIATGLHGGANDKRVVPGELAAAMDEQGL